jgi:hypothetical protein
MEYNTEHVGGNEIQKYTTSYMGTSCLSTLAGSRDADREKASHCVIDGEYNISKYNTATAARMTVHHSFFLARDIEKTSSRNEVEESCILYHTEPRVMQLAVSGQQGRFFRGCQGIHH